MIPVATLLTSTLLLGGPTVPEYGPGFTWDRSTEFETPPFENPQRDARGEPTWYADYVWAPNDDFGTDGPTPWYQQSPIRLPFLDLSWFGVPSIIWSLADNTNPSCAAGIGGAETDIDMQISATVSGAGGTWARAPMIRWRNPTGERVDLDFPETTFELYWGGYATAPMDVVIAHHRPSTGEYDVLYSAPNVARPGSASGPSDVDVRQLTLPPITRACLAEDEIIVTVRAHGPAEESGVAYCGLGGRMPFVWSPDSDQDGLLDAWERAGVGIDGDADGEIDIEFHARGARPDHPDIFVEVDAMSGASPSSRALQRVEAVFAANGFNLDITIDEDNVPAQVWTDAVGAWADFLLKKQQWLGTAAESMEANADGIVEAKRLTYRYALYGAGFTTVGDGGQVVAPRGAAAGFVANDMIIVPSNFPFLSDRTDHEAACFMHELGHLLGLTHGGSESQRYAAFNYKPNYYSVMNYLWQAPAGFQSPGAWRLDYSHAAWPSLDEVELLESDGLQSGGDPTVPANLRVPFRNASGPIRYATVGSPVDWDGDGVESMTLLPHPVEINGLAQAHQAELLTGHDDWANLRLNFREGSYFQTGVPEGALSADLPLNAWEALDAIPPYCVADANGDGAVDFADLNLVLDAWGEPDTDADLDGSGTVDFGDLNLLLEWWGEDCAG